MTQVSSFILVRQTYGGDEIFKNAGCDAMTKLIGFQETVILFCRCRTLGVKVVYIYHIYIYIDI